jgi:hypothetical protein
MALPDKENLRIFEISLVSLTELQCVAMAARSALRLLPLLVNVPKRRGHRLSDAINPNATNLVCMRKIAISRLGASNSTLLRKVVSNTGQASQHSTDLDVFTPTAEFIIGAIESAHFALLYAEASLSENTITSAANALVYPLNAPHKLPKFFETVDPLGTFDVDMFEEAISDLSFCKLGNSNALDGMPLWGKTIPSWFDSAFAHWKVKLHSAGEDWPVWTEWYESILSGAPVARDEELEYYRVTLDSEDDWEKGPAHVNALIKKKQEEIEARNKSLSPHKEPDLSQRPAGHVFDFENGKLVAKPVFGVPGNPSFAEETRQELISKLRDAGDRLRRTQVSARFPESFTKSADFIATRDIPNLPLGKLLSLCRTLEADAAILAGPNLRQMMDEDAQAFLADAIHTLDDFKALFPEIVRIEAARMTLGLATENAVAANLHIDAFSFELVKLNDTVDESAIAAIDETKAAIVELTEEITALKAGDAAEKAMVERAKLVGQRAMAARNIMARGLRAFAVNVGEGVLEGAKEGAKETTKGLIKATGVVLVTSLAGPFAGLASLITIWNPLARKAEDVKRRSELPDDMADV